MQKQYEKIFGERVMTRTRFDKSTVHDKPYFDFYVLMFFYHTINVKENVFLERELKKCIARHSDASCGWDLVMFDWFVLSMRMQVILD